jgi:penicillin-binding protein 1A
LRFACGLLLGLVAGGLAGGAVVVHGLWHELPPVDHLADYAPKLPLRIHARDGTLLAEFGEERRDVVPIGEIPLQLRQALLAIEDSAFYDHAGVDYAGVARAAWSNIVAGAHANAPF